MIRLILMAMAGSVVLRNKAEMSRRLGLHKRGQLDLGRYVNQYRNQPVQASRNGDGGN